MISKNFRLLFQIHVEAFVQFKIWLYFCRLKGIENFLFLILSIFHCGFVVKFISRFICINFFWWFMGVVLALSRIVYWLFYEFKFFLFPIFRFLFWVLIKAIFFENAIALEIELTDFGGPSSNCVFCEKLFLGIVKRDFWTGKEIICWAWEGGNCEYSWVQLSP